MGILNDGLSIWQHACQGGKGGKPKKKMAVTCYYCSKKFEAEFPEGTKNPMVICQKCENEAPAEDDW